MLPPGKARAETGKPVRRDYDPPRELEGRSGYQGGGRVRRDMCQVPDLFVIV